MIHADESHASVRGELALESRLRVGLMKEEELWP